MTKLENKSGLAAAALLLLLTLLFLGKALFPPQGLAIGAHDMRGLFYPWFTYIRDSIYGGSLPLWDPYQFLGYPFLSNPQVAFFYPATWLALIFPVNIAISWYIALHIWLSATGMFFFVRQMGGSWLASLLAAIIFGFSGFTAARIWAGHIGLLATFAWLPWLLWATNWSIRRGNIWSAILAGLPFGLSILAGHTPSFVYVGLIWVAFILYLIVLDRQKWLMIVRQSFIIAAVGIGLAAVQLIPFIELSLNSQRLSNSNFDFASDFSLPPAHLVTLLLPEFFGEPTRVGYWSVPTFEELTYYAGLLFIIVLVLALYKPTRQVWFYLILIIAGLWLALGRESALYRVAFDLFPPVRMMRAPARSAFLFVFAGSALVGHAITHWQGMSRELKSGSLARLFKSLLMVILLVGTVALTATGAAFMAVHPTETSGRLWHQIGGYALALVILLLSGGILWGYLASRPEQIIRKRILATGLILLVIGDLWGFGLKLIRLEPMGPNEMWTGAKTIIGDTEERVLPWGVSIFDQSGSTEVGLNSVFGYQALEPANLVDFVSFVPDPRSSAYDVLAANFVVSPVPLDEFTGGEGGLSLVENQGNAWVYQRSRALPPIRLVYDIEVIPGEASAVGRVHQPDFDATTTVILAEDPDCIIGPPPKEEGTVSLVETKAGYWQISTNSDAGALLLVAESDYPGWQAKVDGEVVDNYRAYTTIRSICVPAGEHIVEWSYQPKSFLIGGVISLVALALLSIGAIKLGFRSNSAEL